MKWFETTGSVSASNSCMKLPLTEASEQVYSQGTWELSLKKKREKEIYNLSFLIFIF